jgi:hypothetical protein
MNIKILYFDGCPSWRYAYEQLRAALKEEGLTIPVELVRVQSDLEAAVARFQGSPSLQYNDQDFWLEERSTYSMNCRVYQTPEGLKGWPTVSMLRQKLQEITKEKE